MSNLAINGALPVRKKEFSQWPVFDGEDEKAILEVLRSGKWCRTAYLKEGLPGSKVEEFEKAFAEYHGAEYAVAVANGTGALEISLRALGIGAGDEVIVPAYTFFATASSVLQINAVPVFADIDPGTYCIDTGHVRKLITDKTKVIIPVHFGGHPADMDELMDIATEHKLKVIEDSSHAHGTEWKSRKIGAIGHAGTFSFQETKNMNSGEGGIILTDDRDVYERCFSYHHIGRKVGGHFYDHHYLAWNYRMTEFQGALLLSQLKRLEEQTERRLENALYLNERISKIDGLEVHKNDFRSTRRAYHLYLFKYNADNFEGVSRERFIDALRAEGIPASSCYPWPLYRNELFANKKFENNGCPVNCPFYARQIDYNKCDCPNVERICRETVMLPQSLLLGTREDMDSVVEAILKVTENIEELRG